MSPTHQIAWIIRSCRESRGYSQEYMADMLNIVQSAYANIESGKTTLRIDRLKKISEILELDIHNVIDEGFQLEGRPNGSQSTIIFPATKEVYDHLIIELRNEIEFLRSLVKEK